MNKITLSTRIKILSKDEEVMNIKTFPKFLKYSNVGDIINISSNVEISRRGFTYKPTVYCKNEMTKEYLDNYSLNKLSKDLMYFEIEEEASAIDKIEHNIPTYYGRFMRANKVKAIREVLEKYGINIDEEHSKNREFFNWYYEGFSHCKTAILKMLKEERNEENENC